MHHHRVRNIGALAAAAAIVAALVVVLTGGTGNGRAETTATAASAAACFGAAVNRDGWDYVSKGATGGSYGVNVGPNTATLSFTASRAEADSIKRQYAVFARAFGVNDVKSLLTQTGNIVVSWDQTPTKNDQQQINRCLTGRRP